ncbi:MAG: T9SS type A sorting domain-containing protein [bacterium]|nr:T9SS type A sorting domain-containing protein [bacterium]
MFAANEEYGLKLIDVSNPQSPMLIDSIDTPGWANRVSTSGHLAFVADNYSGVRVIDFSNPLDLVEVGHLESPHGITRVAVARENTCAVIISNRIQIHDFSVPSSPLQLGYYPSGGNDIVVRDGLAYVLSDSLSIYDISAALSTPEHHNEIASVFSLHPIYPNPFNNTANISFDLPREVTGRLVAYDGLGRVVVTLHDGRFSAGTHSLQFNAENLASGTYFVKLETPDLNSVQKAVLLK